jgi:hypothetical protein
LERYTNIQAATLEPIESIEWDFWFKPGKTSECRLCGHRPSKKWATWNLGFRGFLNRMSRAWSHCDGCHNNSIDKTPLEDLFPGTSVPGVEDDVASSFGSSYSPSVTRSRNLSLDSNTDNAITHTSIQIE